jgi:two-component system, NtrC family, response regulator PilR
MPDARVLIVDDEPDLVELVALTLNRMGLQSAAAANLRDAQRLLLTDPFDLVLCDMRLPDGNGLDLLEWLQARRPGLPCAVITAHGNVETAVRALKLGAFDFLSKPLDLGALRRLITSALKLAERGDGGLTFQGPRLLGHSSPMRQLREMIARVARSQAPVHVAGESGTGKELVAEQIHRRSSRRDRPFVRLNCAAIPNALIEAELFGHARGAFTDAREARAGLFEEANGGTLLLDEIGDMDPAVQARLLRVLEDGTLRRLGESQPRRVNVRVLAATHRDLEKGGAAGSFRQDLFFRLAHVPLHVPPLRQRGEDVGLLFRHFVATFSARHRLRPRQIGEDIFAPLTAYAWPGNVRELRNLCERLVVMGGDPLTTQELPADVLRASPAAEGGWLLPMRVGDGPLVPFRDFKAECEREYLEAALRRCGWNYAAAARVLGLQRTYLHAKAVSLGISRPDQGDPEKGTPQPHEPS